MFTEGQTLYGELDFERNIENPSVKINTTERRVMDGTENIATQIEGNDYSCDVCKRKFKGIKFLQNHTLKKICLKYHDCRLCGKKFKETSKLRRHLKERKKGSCTDRNDCKKCGKIFKDTRSRFRHKKRNSCFVKVENGFGIK